EALARFDRQADLRNGTRAVLAYERWMETRDESLLASIAAYNAEDCRATLALRDWMGAHRPEGARWFQGGGGRARAGPGAGRRRRRRRTRQAAHGAHRGQPPRIGALARRRASRVPPARGATRLVVVLRAPRPHDGGGVARRPRSGRRARAPWQTRRGQEFVRP